MMGDRKKSTHDCGTCAKRTNGVRGSYETPSKKPQKHRHASRLQDSYKTDSAQADRNNINHHVPEAFQPSVG
jgi:hypothetical protein